MIRKNGVYSAAQSFKCPECRQVRDCGSSFVVYCGPEVGDNVSTETGWWGCIACAGIYADLAARPGSN